jgi:hypothetical protein
MRKGDLVRLDVAKCFTVDQGGQLQYPLTNYHRDTEGAVDSDRPTTAEEQADWYESKRQEIAEAKAAGKDTFSIAFDDGGESRLPPQSCSVPLHRDRVYTVVRARARVRLGWGNAQGGYTKILCTVTGEETYIKRDLLEVI